MLGMSIDCSSRTVIANFEVFMHQIEGSFRIGSSGQFNICTESIELIVRQGIIIITKQYLRDFTNNKIKSYIQHLHQPTLCVQFLE